MLTLKTLYSVLLILVEKKSSGTNKFLSYLTLKIGYYRFDCSYCFSNKKLYSTVTQQVNAEKRVFSVQNASNNSMDNPE